MTPVLGKVIAELKANRSDPWALQIAWQGSVAVLAIAVRDPVDQNKATAVEMFMTNDNIDGIIRKLQEAREGMRSLIIRPEGS